MFNPAKASNNIKEEFIDYITTTYHFADDSLNSQLKRELNQVISKGPYLEIKDIFETGKSLNDLIDEGCISPLFRELESAKPELPGYKKILPLNRPLYKHQETSIRLISQGDNVVISTGTGSGKTNCFLIPVINELLREKEKGTLGPGIRAMFIYPMNALANDQIKNIRNLLMCYKDITFGVYNGGTEENEEDAIRLYKSMHATETIPELQNILENELLSRERMKQTPPNILFTNYAMLDHLLLRPQDDVLFSSSNFKFVVLDEAHVYSGATGIETALLLRRLKARIDAKLPTQFILTSATLGRDESSNDDIVKFAENLCGESFDTTSIIRATRTKYNSAQTLRTYDKSIYRELGNEENLVSEVLRKYGVSFVEGNNENEILYDFLLSSDLYDRMRQSMPEISSISKLENELDLDEETAVSFISICTRAIKDGKSLIDARYHFFLRCLEGCYLAFSHQRRLMLTRQISIEEEGKEYSVFEIAVCDSCGRIALVGRIRKDKRLVFADNYDEDASFFYLYEDDNSLIDDLEEDVIDIDSDEKEFFYLCPHCGAIWNEKEDHNPPCQCHGDSPIKLVHIKTPNKYERCGNCHTGIYRRFYLGSEAATGVVATSLYEELPEYEYQEVAFDNSELQDNPFFNFTVEKKKSRKNTARQFLVFSDSRQEAAKFACYLSSYYDEFLRRRGIYQFIQKNIDQQNFNPIPLKSLVEGLTRFFSSKRSFASSNLDDSNLDDVSNRNAWIAVLNELYRYNSPTSLTSLGMIQFSYKGNTQDVSRHISKTYNISECVSKHLLDLLAFEIVKAGAIKTEDKNDLSDTEREYIFHSAKQRTIKLKKTDKDVKQPFVSGWLPRISSVSGKCYRTRKLHYVKTILNCDDKAAYKFLEQYFVYLTSPKNDYHMELDEKVSDAYVMPARNFEVLFKGFKDSRWYRCKKCGKVTQFSLAGHCPIINCNGELEEIDTEILQENNHFAKLYASDKMSPLFIKEHTAQLSKKESALYQEDFIKKKINALSCSTTFEMGVDVGDLETVFLRDVPPLPSNYAQRAGRAGRSVHAAAYSLTYAKLSSHDLSFYKEPEKMINGMIVPPLFKLDNKKIALRHIYAIALSMFFALNEKQYNRNNAEEFINNKGYKQFIAWLESKPEKLKSLINKSIPDINNFHSELGIENFDWVESFSGTEGTFSELIEVYEHNINDMEALIREYTKKDIANYDMAAKLQNRLKLYKSNRLIDFLARGNILPRYGFPVDTVELEQYPVSAEKSELRLTRDLQVAIAEYAPSSEVVANGRLYTSRYIKKTHVSKNNEQWYKAYLGVCDNIDCKALNYSLINVGEEGYICKSCGNKISKFCFYESIEPKAGFIAEANPKPVPMSRQEKNYKSNEIYIENANAKEIAKKYFRFGLVKVKVESKSNDSLLVTSINNFYVCPQCGYAVAADEVTEKQKKKSQKGDKEIILKHPGLYGEKECKCTSLRRESLHHIFYTDVAKLTFDCDTSDTDTMLSAMYAILYTICQELNIERKDIKACINTKIISGRICRSIIIYDAVPGGAGHSKRLSSDDGTILNMIFTKALERMTDCNCNPSCYNCLRSYDNQRIHDRLNRSSAAAFLEQLIGPFAEVDEFEEMT